MTSISQSLLLSPVDISVIEGAARIQDIRLGEALEFSRARDIRQLIESNLVEIESHGSSAARHRAYKGHPYTEYYLSEPQALLICMFARTARAAEVRKNIIDVFMQVRRGEAPRAAKTFPNLRLARRIGMASSMAGQFTHHDKAIDYDEALEWSFRALGPPKKVKNEETSTAWHKPSRPAKTCVPPFNPLQDWWQARLERGMPHWQTQVLTGELFEDFAGKRVWTPSQLRSAMSSFGMHLRRLTPWMRRCRVSIPGGPARSWGYIFPNYQACKDAFEDKTGKKVGEAIIASH